MARVFPIGLFLLLLLPGGISAQVRIHDPVVRTLAKPFGIEKRIRLAGIDDVDFGPDGSGRLTLRLENSGVKQVTLEQPDFQLEVAGEDGAWIGLGRLQVPEILFPVTGEDQSVTRRYVVDYQPASGGAEAVKVLRAAAKDGRALRLVGHAGLRVKLGETKDFHRERLKLELGGNVALGKGFSPRWHSARKSLPAVGCRG